MIEIKKIKEKEIRRYGDIGGKGDKRLKNFGFII